MTNDLDKSKEPAEAKARRIWRNNVLSKKYRDGKLPFVAVVDPNDIDYDNRKVHLSKAAPEPGTVIPTDEAESKLARRQRERRIRELFSFLYEDLQRKKLMAQVVRPRPLTDRELLYRLKLEKLKRLEAMAARQTGESK